MGWLKFIWVFFQGPTEKPERTFSPTQYLFSQNSGGQKSLTFKGFGSSSSIWRPVGRVALFVSSCLQLLACLLPHRAPAFCFFSFYHTSYYNSYLPASLLKEILQLTLILSIGSTEIISHLKILKLFAARFPFNNILIGSGNWNVVHLAVGQGDEHNSAYSDLL